MSSNPTPSSSNPTTKSTTTSPALLSHDPTLNVSALQSLNSTSLMANGPKLPVVQLSTGEKIPTGTIATFLVKLRTYDNLEAAIREAKEKGEEGSEEEIGEKEREQRLVAEEMKLALPLLKMVGMFELFRPEEWVGGHSAGRRVVGGEAARLGY